MERHFRTREEIAASPHPRWGTGEHKPLIGDQVSGSVQRTTEASGGDPTNGAQQLLPVTKYRGAAFRGLPERVISVVTHLLPHPHN